ncbi:MAG: hypothetical protein ISQ91_01415 [Candidatus Pelagibacter bacterium]|nr:hypothetical protein [Candidatus Pelagibacter bacterium]MBL6861129.1 hypothetical protein [Candidatus Pelagibacter bacterium]
MIFLYGVLTNLIYPLLFILILIRIFLKKEDPKRYKEKILISHFNIKRNYTQKLIWFHAASIGELKSVVPIIKKLNSYDNKREFLITTTTLSSSKIAEIEFKNIKNIQHRFFPFDVGFLIDNFLRMWKPNYIFLVDSEIWPNLIFKSKKFKIPIAIINARMTLRSFKRWIRFPNTASKIFSSFKLCLSSNKETKKFLEELDVKNVHYCGNIKFINDINENEIGNLNENTLINNTFWIAASTHPGEEQLCLKTHVFLKHKFKNFLTIIAPRHIERSKKIGELCEKYKLNSQILNSDELIKPNKEVIILNSFGVLQNYFKYAKSVFIGKSTIKKLEDVGGQSPLEAAKLRCKVYHGYYINNFKDIYEILETNNISFKVKDHEELGKYLEKDLNPAQKKNDKISNAIKDLSDKTLTNTLENINNFLLDENK